VGNFDFKAAEKPEFGMSSAAFNLNLSVGQRNLSR
jgi:hypothetical protein